MQNEVVLSRRKSDGDGAVPRTGPGYGHGRRHTNGHGNSPPPLKHHHTFFPFLASFLSKKNTRSLAQNPEPSPPPSSSHGHNPLLQVVVVQGHLKPYEKLGLHPTEKEIDPRSISGQPFQRAHEDLLTQRNPISYATQKGISSQAHAAAFDENKELVHDAVGSLQTQSKPDLLMKTSLQEHSDLHEKDSVLQQVHDDVDYMETVRKLDLHETCVEASDSAEGYASPFAMFLCALCDRVMEDPVVVVSGQTYDRTCFEKWIEEGKTFCPKTKHRLVHFNHAPNLALKNLISLHSKMGIHGILESSPPQSFLCFLCEKIMEDPVIVSSGQTYDRACIQIWHNAGFSLCPITQQPLFDHNMIQNVVLAEKIASWWNTTPPPSSFLCPLCNRVMRDPVVTTSGQTYDSVCLQDAVGTEEYLAPNLSLKDLISCWFNSTASHDPVIGRRSSGISRYSHKSKPLPTTSLPRPITDYSWRYTDSYTCAEPVAHYANPSSGTPRYDSNYYTPKLSKDSSMVSRFSGNVDCISDGSTSHTRSSLVSDGTLSSSEYSSWTETADLDESLSELIRKREHREELRATYSVEAPLPRIINTYQVEKQGNYSEEDDSQHLSKIYTLVSTLQSEEVNKQRRAAEELRIMARTNDNRTSIANSGAVTPLIALLQSNDKLTQMHATTTLLNLSLDKDVRPLIVENGAINQLVRVVKGGLSPEAKGNAAMALSSIWEDVTDDIKITSSVAIPPLVELLHTGSKSNKKDAASALYRLSTVDENKRKMIRSGICKCLLNFLIDNDGMVEKAMTLLRKLVAVEEGRVAFVAEEGISIVLDIIKKGSRVSKACGVSIFLQICKHSKKHRALLCQKDPFYALTALYETTKGDRKTEINELLQLLKEPT